MAMTTRTSLDDDDFDPLGPIDLIEIVPNWRRRPDEIARDARVSYDRRSDTLHLHGSDDRGNNVVVQVGDSARFVLVDRATWAVVGFHIEAFISQVLAELPVLSVALDQAALRGITRDEVEMTKRRLKVRSNVDIGDALAKAYADAGWTESIAV